ncbi:YcjF family protein [Ruegeria sp. HKCCD7255]|uniref:YcjF family protein n=1 Tax=Ruegeria sp. HKCCD7255 TaxID=2683004 RepID=UPI0014896078|nr:TIGR01620 family protein [Ruegeria sp. HKCCD7255]
MAKGPVLFDLDDDTPETDVAQAPPVPDIAQPQEHAMQGAARLAGRKPSALSKWFWGLAVSVVGAVVSVAAWDFAQSLLDRSPVLGTIVSGLIIALLCVVLIIVIRELAAIGRLSRVDGMRRAADTALAEEDLAQARAVTTRLLAFYAGRDETRWGHDRLTERMDDQFDVSGLLGLAEDELLASLDTAASREVEAAARQVATVTALVPLALADVATALASSLRMIRRIAEIYGGRAGFLGSWRLTRAVFVHLVATGAVAVGDDLLEPILGSSVLSKLSRRFGEGLVNGALTARVGVAAMEVCRPLPFSDRHKPSTRGVIKRALSGVFNKT